MVDSTLPITIGFQLYRAEKIRKLVYTILRTELVSAVTEFHQANLEK
jgi:hypothetical protein